MLNSTETTRAVACAAVVADIILDQKSVTGVAQSVIRYHLAIAAKQDLGLRAAHHGAQPPAPARLTAAGKRNLQDILASYQAEGRRPVTTPLMPK
ncbi:hypothetical protein [Arthrobacter sp. M4]|uniref:hypothetical protein n=1 Tax=Arthrobacter sp. M4 TaxID=218160 RepID=UPI001CDD0D48|nr:hypothetical protein [Arthrobacter sp. M4]MCA4132630.1 hypothetical protein [Arthrobacter sp. M4]